MDLLKNPFHILGATTRDHRHRIIELEEERSLLGDANECVESRSILITPSKRISAEVAWLPGVDPTLYDEILRHLDAPNQIFFNINRLTHIARANLLVSKLSRLPNLLSSNTVERILTIAQTSETINSDTVCAILNEDRRVSGFPEITDQSAIDDAIRNQKRYYSQIITSILENLSVNERARVMTSLLETTTSNGRYQCPTLIKDLIPAYQRSVLEPKRRIIEAQVEQLRAMADAQHPDTTVSPIVDQLLESLQEWATLAQPIQLSIQNTGQRHQASSEVAFTVREVTLHLCNEHRQLDFAIQITNVLIDVFNANSVGVEVVTRLTEDRTTLVGMRSFENINTQVERLRTASDTRHPDYTLTPMVNQLIQSVRSWDTTTQLVETNNAVAITVRNVALHLCNEHQQLDFAIQITNALIGVFNGVYGMDEVNNRLSEDIIILHAMDRQRRQATGPQPDRKGTGCLLQIVIFAILALIGALSQGC